MQADIVDAAGVDLGQRLRHAVDEGLAADEAHAGPRHGLAREVLAAAKTDLEADVIGSTWKQRTKITGSRRAEVEREPRQQGVHQRRLART